MVISMEYTYSFRIYPNEKQKVQLAKTFGCCRFVYNYFLDDFYKEGYTSEFTKNNKCNRELKDYSIREWQCSSGSNLPNRDFNAANNILDKGLELLFV